MKNCTQCPNLDQYGKICNCTFYNKTIPNVDFIPIWCNFYKNISYPSLDRALNFLNFALLTTEEPAPDIPTIKAAIISAIEDIKTIRLGL